MGIARSACKVMEAHFPSLRGAAASPTTPASEPALLCFNGRRLTRAGTCIPQSCLLGWGGRRSPLVAPAGQGAPPRSGSGCPNRAARPGVAASSAFV